MSPELRSSAKAPSRAWLSFHKPNPHAKLRIFCFPYAGGSALIYRGWDTGLPPHVEVCPVQLPGRGARIREAHETHIGALARVVYSDLRTMLDKPFVFFGHSMGALLSFELARVLRSENAPTPSHLFVSATSAPHRREKEPILSSLPDDELLAQLHKFNGTPKEVLENEELMRLLLPLLRADFALCDTYEYTNELPLDCGITALGGLEDRELERDRLEAWRDQTTSSFSLRMLPGDHFFIHSSQGLILRALSQDLHQIAGKLT